MPTVSCPLEKSTTSAPHHSGKRPASVIEESQTEYVRIATAPRSAAADVPVRKKHRAQGLHTYTRLDGTESQHAVGLQGSGSMDADMGTLADYAGDVHDGDTAPARQAREAAAAHDVTGVDIAVEPATGAGVVAATLLRVSGDGATNGQEQEQITLPIQPEDTTVVDDGHDHHHQHQQQHPQRMYGDPREQMPHASSTTPPPRANHTQTEHLSVVNHQHGQISACAGSHEAATHDQAVPPSTLNMTQDARRPLTESNSAHDGRCQSGSAHSHDEKLQHTQGNKRQRTSGPTKAVAHSLQQPHVHTKSDGGGIANSLQGGRSDGVCGGSAGNASADGSQCSATPETAQATVAVLMTTVPQIQHQAQADKPPQPVITATPSLLPTLPLPTQLLCSTASSIPPPTQPVVAKSTPSTTHVGATLPVSEQQEQQMDRMTAAQVLASTQQHECATAMPPPAAAGHQAAAGAPQHPQQLRQPKAMLLSGGRDTYAGRQQQAVVTESVTSDVADLEILATQQMLSAVSNLGLRRALATASKSNSLQAVASHSGNWQQLIPLPSKSDVGPIAITANATHGLPYADVVKSVVTAGSRPGSKQLAVAGLQSAASVQPQGTVLPVSAMQKHFPQHTGHSNPVVTALIHTSSTAAEPKAPAPNTADVASAELAAAALNEHEHIDALASTAAAAALALQYEPGTMTAGHDNANRMTLSHIQCVMQNALQGLQDYPTAELLELQQHVLRLGQAITDQLQLLWVDQQTHGRH